MPTTLVTGSAERMPDIAIALKTAGFDILTAGPLSDDVLPLLPQGATVLVVTDAPGRASRPAPADPAAPEALPWWLYAGVEPESSFADWRDTVMCLSAVQSF